MVMIMTHGRRFDVLLRVRSVDLIIDRLQCFQRAQKTRERILELCSFMGSKNIPLGGSDCIAETVRGANYLRSQRG